MPRNQLVQVPITGGVDQKVADEYLDPMGRLVEAQNVVWLKEGGLDKRFGVKALAQAQMPGDPSMGAVARMRTRGTELAATDGDKLYSYSPSAGRWAYRSLVSPCKATRQQFPNLVNVSGYGIPSMAEGSGLRLVAYNDSSNNVWVSIYDSASNAPLQQNHFLGNGINPICMVIGAQAYVFAFSGSNLLGWVFTISSMTWGTQTTIVTDAQTGFAEAYDAVPYVGSTGILLTYVQATGGNLNVRYLRLEALPALTISASGVIQTYAAASFPDVPFLASRHRGDLNVAWFIWQTIAAGGAVATSAVSYNTNVSPWTANTLFTPAIPALSTSSAGPLSVEVLSSTLGLVTGSYGWATYNTAGALQSSNQFGYGAGSGLTGFFAFASRPFLATAAGVTRCYALAYLTQPIGAVNEASYYLVDLRAFEASVLPRVVATLAPRQAATASYPGGAAGFFATVTNPGQPTAGTYRTLVWLNGQEEFSVGTNPMAQIATFDFTQATTWQTVEGPAGVSYQSGGVPAFYDGTGEAELGFFAWPSQTAAATATTGGNLSAGTYLYQVCFAELDPAGQVHRSALLPISGGALTSVPATGKVTLSLTNLPMTGRYRQGRSPVIEIYRTQVNQTTLYYIGSVACQPANNTATLTYVDSASDASIASNPLAYTTGGIVDSVCPPSFQCILRHNGRLWGIDDTGYVVWYTTQFNGSDAPYFNESLTLQLSDQLTALAEMDDKLVLFSSSGIQVLIGDGPPATGIGGDFQSQSPTIVMTDVGAADWRSVVKTPAGVFFQAPSGGIYLLDRSLQVAYVGKAVQDWVGTTSVVSARLVPASNQVRFVLQSGSVVTFDYVLGRWSRFTYAFTPSLSDSIVLGTTWYVSDSPPITVYREKTATDVAPWRDEPVAGPQWVQAKLTTAWVKLGGLQGDTQLEQVLTMGRFLDPADMFITVSYDYGTSSQGPTQYLYSAMSAVNNVEARVQLGCQATSNMHSAVQVTLYDGAPTGGASTTYRGIRFLGVALDVAILSDRYRNLSATVKQ